MKRLPKFLLLLAAAALVTAAAASASYASLPSRPTINWDRQGKHVPGHKNYQHGKSILTHPDPQKLLNNGVGNGDRHGDARSGFKEVVDFGEHIGLYVDQSSGAEQSTTRGTIHYDSGGRAHIVPAKPSPRSGTLKLDSSGCYPESKVAVSFRGVSLRVAGA